MDADNALGDYLRARRGLLMPADVGLPEGSRQRRVVGLRREEVAFLAGISPEYYLRLEQGRERHPSDQVLASIASALRLGTSSQEFLQRMVRPLPERGHDTSTAAELSARVYDFVMSMRAPAFAHDRVLEVLVANPAARELSPSFVPGVNLIRAAFFDPALLLLYRNWDDMTSRLVSYLRAQAATPPLDSRLEELVTELRTHERFTRLWARHDVGTAPSGVNSLNHPVLGDLELHYERLTYAGTDHPVIVTYYAPAGSASASALARLGTEGSAIPVA